MLPRCTACIAVATCVNSFPHCAELVKTYLLKTYLNTRPELAHKLAMVANEKCKAAIDAYNDCCRGRSVSMAWACRETYDASEACIKR